MFGDLRSKVDPRGQSEIWVDDYKTHTARAGQMFIPMISTPKLETWVVLLSHKGGSLQSLWPICVQNKQHITCEEL